MSLYTQDNRLISITTPLGKDGLLITGISGSEHISGLFEFGIEALSENHFIEAKELVGKAVTVKIHDANERFFNGYVNELSHGDLVSAGPAKGFRQYGFSIVPWMWFLSKRTNCRIFQEKDSIEIIKEIFKDHGAIAKFKTKLTGGYDKREYCVQYNETDLEFVIRLMEEDGIAYYFEHTEKEHMLVLTDKKDAYELCKEKKVKFNRGSPAHKHIDSWNHQYTFGEGKRTERDYNFKKPKDKLECSTPTKIDLPMIKSFENYSYPGFYDNSGSGTRQTKNRMVGEELAYDVVDGSSNCSSFIAGTRFEMIEHETKKENKEYILTSVHHSISEESYYTDGGSSSYMNTFTCIPASVHFRPLPVMIKPVMHGPQTAVVVGKKGEEIDIDKYGRIKVQFYWDREGKYDEKSSCWIRVAQGYAGNKWGVQFTPRIGQEVIVNYLDGDPDRPIVTGAVYNQDNMPPYTGGEKTRDGIKSHSTLKGGASNFNEFRFEDKKGSEEIFIQAEKDYRWLVKNDEESEIKNNKTIKVTKASKQEAKSIYYKAADFIEFKVGGSTIKMTPTGILIKTTKCDIKGSAMVVVKGGLVKIN